MDKVVVIAPEPQNAKIIFGDMSIEVVPFISAKNRLQILKAVLSSMFSTGKEVDRFTAEYAFMLSVLDQCSSIEIFNSEGAVSFNLDILFYTDLFKKVTEKIYGFNDFEAMVWEIMEDETRKRELEISTGAILEQIKDVIVSFSQKFTPQEFLDTTKEMIKEVENSKVSKFLKEKKVRKTKNVEEKKAE